MTTMTRRRRIETEGVVVYIGPLEREVWSHSTPGKKYRMVWAPVSGWVHADSTCPSFRECWHREAAGRDMTSLVVRSQGEITDESRAVLLVEYDPKALAAGVDPEIAAKWAYDIPTVGKGLGVRGIEEGVRLLASRGEIIRVPHVTLVSHDDREAFFEATATRFVINPETGMEVQLDSQTRGKRVPKWDAKSNGQGEYFVKNWYEIGISKAARNAAAALMPSNVKSAILQAGLEAASRGGNRPSQQQASPQRQTNANRPVNQNQGQDALTMFWTDARNAKLDQDAVLDASQRLYNNREPKDLTPQERIDLLRQLTTRPEDVAAQQAPLT